MYTGSCEGPVIPEPHEAEAFAWATLDGIRAAIAKDPGRYSVWFRQYVAAEWPTALAPPD